MSVTVLITGADGFVGRVLTAKLSGAGYRVRAAVRSAKFGDAVEVGDIERFRNWNAVLEDVDAVVHLAARAHVTNGAMDEDGAEFQRINVRGTVNLARAAAEASVRRFVFLSSIGVNGNSTSIRPFVESDLPNPVERYAISKWDAEQALLQLGAQTDMELVRVRPPLVMGPGVKGNLARLLRLVDFGVPLPFGAIANSRQYIDVADLCDLLELCVTGPAAANTLFLAAGHESISTPSLLRHMACGLGRRSSMISTPASLLRAMAAMLGRGEDFAKLSASLRIDASAAQTLLGWTPRVTLTDSIASMASGYVEEKAKGRRR